MMAQELKTEVSIDAAHRLSFHKGKCKNLHGHRWKIIVDMYNETSTSDMLVDFGDVKGFFDRFDHTLLVYQGDEELMNATSGFSRVISSFETTAENLSKYFATELQKLCPEGTIVRVEVYETPSNVAAFTVGD